MTLNQSRLGYTQTVKLHNTRDRQLLLRLEPWGEQAFIGPGQSIQVTATGPEPLPNESGIEVEDGIDEFVVYGWPGCTISVTSKNVTIAGSAIPVPETPAVRRQALTPTGVLMRRRVSSPETEAIFATELRYRLVEAEEKSRRALNVTMLALLVAGIAAIYGGLYGGIYGGLYLTDFSFVIFVLFSLVAVIALFRMFPPPRLHQMLRETLDVVSGPPPEAKSRAEDDFRSHNERSDSPNSQKQDLGKKSDTENLH
jgi:hypothetical protein